MKRVLLLCLAAAACARSQPAPSVAAPASVAGDDLGAALARVPVELELAGGDLRVINLYKLEALAIRDSAGRSTADIVDRLTREVYAPYTAFWNGYLGDEASFREWATTKLLAPEHPIRSTLSALLGVGLDSLFTGNAEWLAQKTGHRPRGTWYIVYGPGWTDMGGLGDLGMVADFTRQSADRASLTGILPHELAHQVHAVRSTDPDAGTVLSRIVSEGLASYVSFVHARGTRSAASSVGYTDAEWAWALAHEREIVAAAQPYLRSTKREHLDGFAARNEHPVAGGPGAIGYFLGFRIVEAYVARHGPESWTAVLSMPVREVLVGSGYPM
jgi:hypothetical protein